jgi:hypothetical protein
MVGHEVTPDDICNNFRAKYLPIFWIVVLRTDPDLIFEVEQAVCDSRDVGSLLLNNDLYYAIFTELQRAKDYAAKLNADTGCCPVVKAV